MVRSIFRTRSIIFRRNFHFREKPHAGSVMKWTHQRFSSRREKEMRRKRSKPKNRVNYPFSTLSGVKNQGKKWSRENHEISHHVPRTEDLVLVRLDGFYSRTLRHPLSTLTSLILFFPFSISRWRTIEMRARNSAAMRRTRSRHDRMRFSGG